jgi:hypothetical protein
MNAIEFMRGMVRPIVTLLFTVSLIVIVTEGIQAPEWFIGLGSGCVVWWFSDRTINKVKKEDKDA